MRGPRVRIHSCTTVLVPIVLLMMLTRPPTLTHLIPWCYARHMTRNNILVWLNYVVWRPLVDAGCNTTGVFFSFFLFETAGHLSNDFLTFPVPGLFEGMPGANRACAGCKPAAGPAVPTGDGCPGRKQGQRAARPVQHPHRRTRRQLMNSHRCAELMTVYRWTNGSYKEAGAASITSRGCVNF